MRLRWNNPNSGNRPFPTNWEISYQVVGDESTAESVTISGDLTSYNLRSLSPATDYSVTIGAVEGIIVKKALLKNG